MANMKKEGSKAWKLRGEKERERERMASFGTCQAAVAAHFSASYINSLTHTSTVCGSSPCACVCASEGLSLSLSLASEKKHTHRWKHLTFLRFWRAILITFLSLLLKLALAARWFTQLISMRFWIRESQSQKREREKEKEQDMNSTKSILKYGLLNDFFSSQKETQQEEKRERERKMEYWCHRKREPSREISLSQFGSIIFQCRERERDRKTCKRKECEGLKTGFILWVRVGKKDEKKTRGSQVSLWVHFPSSSSSSPLHLELK